MGPVDDRCVVQGGNDREVTGESIGWIPSLVGSDGFGGVFPPSLESTETGSGWE